MDWILFGIGAVLIFLAVWFAEDRKSYLMILLAIVGGVLIGAA